jgi:hypothetical protein
MLLVFSVSVGVLLVMTAGRTVDFFFRKDLPARLTEINFGSNTSFVNRTKSQAIKIETRHLTTRTQTTD